ncbi:Bardet-Biedl syndrome 1 protein isoform X2 [Bicyclus anynana]|uniref:Bardet-Biedl syndrome 1 protein isoform X2 n=1 Tax=Bicyclus anynana TaxID=110368 RepID=A0ABM3LF29_BICAN|nr:Bardet-Biedl syndrome 1 protein isoform X2 [Bicyclus anynana]
MGGMSRWLDVEAGNDDIDINTLPSNIALVDLQNDNEFKLVIGDLGRGDEGPRLKIFKGAMQISDLELPDLPLGVVSLYTSETLPRSTPLIAVGFSMGVYVYRNFKLFYKYYLPTVELNTSEMEVWRQLTNPENHKEETIIALSETLHNMPQKVLSIQSRDFLSLTLEQQLEFLENATDLPKKRHREVACITTMRMNSVDRYSVSCLIVGTEDGEIIVLDPQTFTQIYLGKKQWLVSLEQRAVALTLLPVLQLGATLVAVALASGHVHLYDGKATRDTIFLRDVVSVMKFGQLGQEEHVFIIITSNGNLMLKILKRTADFNPHAAGIEPTASAAAQKPWLIPKKSKLFLEQSARERENAIAMHESFQLELNRLRLVAARTLLEAHTKSDNFVGAGVMEPIRLSAEVEGLGPVFRVTLVVENTSAEKAVIGLAVLFHVHSTHYKVYNPYIKVPLLGPGNQIKFPTKIEEIFSDNINPDVFFRNVTGQAGEGSLIKVLLLKDGRSYPVLAATVTMPPTDPLMIPYDKIKTSDFGTVD